MELDDERLAVWCDEQIELIKKKFASGASLEPTEILILGINLQNEYLARMLGGSAKLKSSKSALQAEKSTEDEAAPQ